MDSTHGFSYGAVPETEAPVIGALLSQALHFNLSPDDLRAWVERAGYETFRVVRQGDKIACGLRLMAMGQWFGGARMPIMGINAVGAAPEFRGQGATTLLMQRMHEEIRAQGYGLSVLFPATLTFYRRTGYERAGVWNTYELALDAIHVRERSVNVIPAAEADFETIYRTYDRRAAQCNGHLDRPPQMWKMRLEPKGKITYRYLFQRNGQTEGYVAYVQGGQLEPIQVNDHCVLTPEAGRRLLQLFADHRSLATTMVWKSGPNDPLLYLLDETKYKLTETLDWVVRIVDVETALRQRGYPTELNTELHLDVEDTQLPWNHGRFVLRVQDGKATVEGGGDGTFRLDARTLATLFTGHLTARELRIAGRLTASDTDVTRAQLIFSGPQPWMPDIF